MLFSIDDVKDWQALKQGRFKKDRKVFNLEIALNEIKSSINFHVKSNKKKITFMFEPNFSKVPNKNDIFVELVQLEQIQNRLDELD